MSKDIRICKGEFTYSTKMPWGPWQLTMEPKLLFEVGNISVFGCIADELVEDEQGVAPMGDIGYDPRFRHFIIGQKRDGEIVWWHILQQEYEKGKGYVNCSITLEKNQVVVKGYGGYGPYQRKTVYIDIDTGKEYLC